MTQEHKSVLEMWNQYLELIDEDIDNTSKKYTSWHFCNDEKNASELALLVKEGTKRGTASLYYLYEIENEQIPSKDEYSVIINYGGATK